MSDDKHRGPIGSDGLTPKERMEAAGYELDNKGHTVELGYDGAKNAATLAFEVHPWAWLDERPPDLELRCSTTRLLVAEVWKTPTGEVWYRSDPARAKSAMSRRERSAGNYQGRVGHDHVTERGHQPVVCAVHGLVHVSPAWISDQLAAKRRFVSVPCEDPSPMYRRP